MKRTLQSRKGLVSEEVLLKESCTMALKASSREVVSSGG